MIAQLNTVEFDQVRVSLLELRVWLGEREIHFTLTELRLLLVFLVEPYRVISRAELVERAQLTNVGALHTLICRLRLLLGQRYIHTVRGKAGYAFAWQGRRTIVVDDAVTAVTAR